MEDFDSFPKGAEVRLVIGQSKMRNGFKADVGAKFLMTFSDFFGVADDVKRKRKYSPDLESFFGNFTEFWYEVAKKRPKLFVDVYQCTMAESKPHQDVVDSMNIALEPFRNSFRDADVSCHLWGAPELFDRVTEAPSYDSDLKYYTELDVATGKVALVRLGDYFNFLKGDKGKLNSHFFEQNVRDYQGSVKVNKEIRASLEQGGGSSDFWWLNNGITMLVSEPPISRNKEYSLRDVQIVNGLQTSHTIFHFFSERPDALEGESRMVLVRILASDNEDEKSEIIRATNSQTAVQPASLRATGAVHRRIEDVLKLKGLYYDRRKNYYKNIGKSPKDIVSITLLSQAVMSAFLMRPDTARARPSSFLANDETYEEIFEERPEEDFIWAATRQKFIEEVISSELDVSPMEKNNIKFYVLLVVRVLGAYSATKKALWKVDACSNGWKPTKQQVVEAFDWVYGVAWEIAADEDVSLDSVCKGSRLLEVLAERWVEDAEVVKSIYGAV